MRKPVKYKELELLFVAGSKQLGLSGYRSDIICINSSRSNVWKKNPLVEGLASKYLVGGANSSPRGVLQNDRWPIILKTY